MKKLLNFITLLIIAGLVLYHFDFFSDNSNEKSKISENMPMKEYQFIDIVKNAVDKSGRASNDLQKSAIKTERTEGVCGLIKGDLSAVNWVGKVAKLDSNNDGKGVLVIEISKNISLKTWNNSLSDGRDKTLIEKDSELFQKALSLKKGDLVKFSGNFIHSDDDCIREASVTLSGGVDSPDFIFKFRDISLL